MTDKLRAAAQAALTAVETVLNDAFHRRFPECCGHPQGSECCGNWNEAMTPDDNRIMDLLSPVRRQLSEALRAALAEQDAEPVAWLVRNGVVTTSLFASEQDARTEAAIQQKRHDLSGSWAAFRVEPLYTHPPRREWVGLTDEEIDRVTDQQWARGNNKPIYAAHRAYARAIEQKLKEKNHEPK